MYEAFTYRGRRTREISFPLGGIGAGSVGFAGNGRLVDWEIYNRPHKGSTNGFSHLAIRAEAGGEVLDTRVLNGDYEPPYTGSLRGDAFGGYGFGAPRDALCGIPHFQEWSFVGTFPIAELHLADEMFPGKITVRAFNPFIPHDSRESSMPAAFFEVLVTNTTDRRVDYTVPFVLRNPFPRAAAKNTVSTDPDGRTTLLLAPTDKDPSAPDYGQLAVTTDCAAVSYQEYLFRGAWFDTLSVYWSDLTAGGEFTNRTYAEVPRDAKGYSGSDFGLIAPSVAVEPGATEAIRFVLGWYFPTCTNYWNPVSGDSCCGDSSCDDSGEGASGCNSWRNYYATLFPDASAVVRHGLSRWDHLWRETESFRTVLFDSTLPKEVIDAVSANISILKTPTCLRLEDGTFYGFEGCHPDAGCCEGSCQHVWNYAYALPFLFPDLERSMREADFTYNMAPDGGMSFRLQLPLGRERSAFRPCADGQFGAVIKTYREWKISGDTEWLRRQWPAVRKAIAYAWSDENPDRWDHDRDGVLEGRQHHTLDMELFGPNSWLTGFYLAALKAAAEMASRLGDDEHAREYLRLFESGKARVDAELFNGEYYHQLVDLQDRATLESYRSPARVADDPVETYWDAEHGQMKYQVDEGCGIDQVVAQWHANLVGLGDVFDRDQTRAALAAIYRYNFVERFRDVFNPCRIFGLNDESGTLICSFPRSRPVVPIPYAEEAMHGFEYQVACHMIQEGMVDEGLRLVGAVRDRYDGEKRNPWNEVECGSNYARSMAAYSLLLALSGFEFDMTRGHIGFSPVRSSGRFGCLFSVDACWGKVSIDSDSVELAIHGGSLSLRSIAVGGLGAVGAVEIVAGETTTAVSFSRDGSTVELTEPARIPSGAVLRLRA